MKILEEKFEQMGARVKFRERRPTALRRRLWAPPGQTFATGPKVVVDIRQDEKGEYFELTTTPDADLKVVDLRPDLRHLLLLSTDGKEKSKFLCGHDERHWFTAAIPETSGASNVLTAMRALKPVEVVEAESKQGVAFKKSFKRHNKGSLRQGEWFFVPDKIVTPPPKAVLKNEPLISKAGGKPHTCEFLYRVGGRQVWVGTRAVSGMGRFRRENVVLEEKEYQALSPEDLKRGMFRPMRENPTVFVKGRVSHADHATLILDGWHRVYMNTERKARAASAVRFLD